MGDSTEIAWTDSTFNPWWGCTKIAPGCDHCYAEALDRRWGGGHWGAGNKPRFMSDAYWKKPMQWNKKAERDGKRHKVFCGSMCDWADTNAPDGQRDRLWQVIRETPFLDWQLLTKRATNIKRFLPDDWGEGFNNVWLGVSVEDQKYGLPRIQILRDIPAQIRFLSIEPLLEDLGYVYFGGIHWVIVGGESGHHARPMETMWPYALLMQCRNQGVPFFFKQWGGKKDKGGSLITGQHIKEWPSASTLLDIC